MSRLKKGEWAVMVDGDTAFLVSNFGHQIKEYIKKHPDTGIFTCYASRSHYDLHVPAGVDMKKDSIIYHKNKANQIYSENHLQTIEINRRISGHLIVIKRETWYKIRDRLKHRVTTKKKEILGFDTQLSYSILDHKLKIRLMKGLYILHYCRLKEGFAHKAHLL